MTKMNMNQIEINEFSRKKLYFSVIEALLFVSGEPLKIREISNIIEQEIDSTKELIFELQKKYEEEERGIMLISINDEYQLVSKPQNSDYIQKLLKTNTRQSLSQASLETLAIIAYKQPITRVSIDEIRGVKSDRAVLTLLDKGLIKEAGRMEVAGRPILYSTTEKFLLYFGLENLKQMPSLEEILKDEDMEIEEDKSEIETKE